MAGTDVASAATTSSGRGDEIVFSVTSSDKKSARITFRKDQKVGELLEAVAAQNGWDPLGILYQPYTNEEGWFTVINVSNYSTDSSLGI